MGTSVCLTGTDESGGTYKKSRSAAERTGLKGRRQAMSKNVCIQIINRTIGEMQAILSTYPESRTEGGENGD